MVALLELDAHRAISVLAVLLICAITATAGVTSSALRISFYEKGTMTVARGRISHTMSIISDITGCAGRVYDGSNGDLVQRSGWKTKVLSVDTLRKGPTRYAVLLLIASFPNCNIQGNCGGAGENVSVLLVHLNDKLDEVERWRVDVQNCQGGADVLEAELPAASGEDENYPNWYRRTDMANGRLRVRYTRYQQGLLKEPYARDECELLYETSRAGEGLRIEVRK